MNLLNTLGEKEDPLFCHECGKPIGETFCVLAQGRLGITAIFCSESCCDTFCYLAKLISNSNRTIN